MLRSTSAGVRAWARSFRPWTIAFFVEEHALRSSSYSAPGVQKVQHAPSRFEVRYYRNSDADEAAKLSSKAAGLLGIPATDIAAPRSLEGRYKALPERTMEIWFPGAA